ncbi:MAG: hypothetical protein AVDCRST_MAG65-870 [uncultured Solirubrobacteraceae bacterium]|uniref:Uncharacterized protein n=1 Tax=uncultured Solirubrobacteraceae bacterium TaxID=1162706 RepID=A0A6J4RR10_9ACTN|nr:MAG: hypothetical protein AVDCRST_MAG65-870 [uncultured Solirubrobacteraceae bacterium]
MSEVQPASELPLASAQVASSIPGRLRLRLPATAAGRHRLATAAAALAGHDEFLVAEPRPGSGSLVLHYDPAHSVDVWVRLRALGLQVSDAAPGGSAASVDPSTRVMTALRALDALVPGVAAGHDLRTLVPLTYGLLAARQFVRGEQRLADAPWYVLAWYASESFQKAQRSRGGNDG